jgi:outer membrane protein OmpA-like peptidoglycan-associated protein
VRRILIGCSTVLAVMALTAMQPSPSLAQDVARGPGVDREVCNPVMSGNRNPVMSGSGTVVLHSNSYTCPEVAEPEPPPEPEPMPPIVISGDVLFEFDRSNIRPEFFGELNQIAARLQETPDRQIRISGHTDSTGPATYNQGLSERRAQSVANYLAQQGVSPDRMIVQGFGETQPVVSNETREGRAQNRRVEIETL